MDVDWLFALGSFSMALLCQGTLSRAVLSDVFKVLNAGGEKKSDGSSGTTNPY
jgi:hypothetical protein